MDFLSILRAVREHKWLFLGASLLALGFLLFGPSEKAFVPVYSSKAKILLTPPTVVAYSSGGVDTPLVQSWFSDETTLRELVASEELLGRVSSRLQLREPWTDFRGRVYVQIVSRQSRQVTLFQIEVIANKPEASQQQTMVLVEEFIKYVQELSAREYASTRRFLVELVTEANTQLQKAQQTLLKSKAITSTKDGTDVLARRRLDLQAQRSQALQQVGDLRTKLAELRSAEGSQIPPWAVLEQKNSSLESLRDVVTKERAKLNELERTFLPNTDEVIAQRARVQSSENLYQKEVSRSVESLLRRTEADLAQAEATIQVADGELEKLAMQEPTAEDRLQFSQRERQLSVWQENYLALTRRLYEAKVNEQMSKRQGAFSILERPQPGTPLINPGANKRPAWQRYAIGIPFCFVFGLGVVMVQEYLRSSLRMQPKIEEALELPIIGTVPKLDKNMARRWEKLRRSQRVDDDEASEDDDEEVD